jgi:hypothetical protein
MKPDAPALYEDGKNNTLLNDVFFYVLHHLPRLQNMHEYSVDIGQDIEAFVKRKYPQLEGPPSVPPVFFFSKNLLAYLETLVAFSPYYRADDARMAGIPWEDGGFLPGGCQPLQSIHGRQASQLHHKEADCLVRSLPPQAAFNGVGGQGGY